MMRVTSVAIVAVVLMLLGCDTSSRVEPIYQDYFIKYYGADGNQEGKDLYVNEDGTMILLGNSSSLTENSIPFIVKTDSLGNVLWQRQLGGQNEAAVDVEFIPGGTHQGKLVVLSNISDGIGNYSIRVTIVDQEGTGVDSLVLPNTGLQFAKGVTPSSNNDFLITGYASPDPDVNPKIDPSEDKADIIFLRVSQSLTVLKTIRQGGEKEGWGVKVFEVNLQDTVKYAVFGYSDRPESEGTAAFIPKFDMIVFNVNGIQSIRRTAGQNGDITKAAQAIRVPAAQGDGFLMIGTAENGSDRNIFIARYSKDFIEEFPLAIKLPKTSKMEGVAAAAGVAEDGYFLLANQEQENSNNNIFLTHVQRDGAEIWSTTFGSEEGDDRAGAVAALRGGRIAVLGTIELETQRKMALIIVAKTGSFSN